MLYLPPEIQNHIFSYLPILTEEKKIIHYIIKEYNSYFLNILRIKRNYQDIYNYWLKINKPIKQFLETNKFTMVQIRQFYNFAIQYDYLIEETHSL
jgi:hypothetical protein|tara:strand:- start:5176 stop:5463 length:288 start_codon:yes stop_codon:yes gene_type:complete